MRGCEQALAACVSLRTLRYLFHSLPRLVCAYFLVGARRRASPRALIWRRRSQRAVPKKIIALNRSGVVKMHKNLFLLQKALPAFGQLDANNAHFDRVRTFFGAPPPRRSPDHHTHSHARVRADLALAPPNELSTLASAKGFSPQQIATLVRLRGSIQSASQNPMLLIEKAATGAVRALS